MIPSSSVETQRELRSGTTLALATDAMRPLPRAVLPTACLLLATMACSASCSSRSSNNAAVSSGDDAGAADASDGDAATVACDDPRAAPTMDCGSLRWSISSTTSRARNHHVTVVAHTTGGDFLYAIGGVNVASAMANVDRAPIGADGSLGPFTGDAPLPVAVGGLSGAVAGGVIVVEGGNTGTTITDEAYSTAIRDDGTLAGWKPAGSVLEQRMHSVAFAVGSNVYVLGGFYQQQVWNDAVIATVQPDGTVSTWKHAGVLPGPRSHFAATPLRGYVYISGGLSVSAYDNPPALKDVSRARIDDTGALVDWTPMTPLPVGLATHASFSYGGYLYVAGGISGDSTELTTIEKRVWRAPIQADASLGAWQPVASLPIARAHVHQLPLLGDHVYSVAGAIDFGLDSTTQVDIGSFR